MLQCCPHTLIDKWSPDVQCANTTTHCSSFPNHKTSRTLWVVMKLVIIIIIIIIHTLFLPTRSHMQRDWLSLRCVKSLHLPWCHLEISSSSALTPVQSHVRCGLIKSDWRLSHFRVRDLAELFCLQLLVWGKTKCFNSREQIPLFSLLLSVSCSTSPFFFFPFQLSGEVISLAHLTVMPCSNHFKLLEICYIHFPQSKVLF